MNKKQIYNILMMPILCKNHSGFNEKRKVDIKREGNLINTSQTYWPQYKGRNIGEPVRYDFKSDCDMSDFACGFYEIIYKDMLDGKKIVDDIGNLTNKQYAGDTMTSVSKLPQLKDTYHCLANFWLLPMDLGRTSKNEWCKTYKSTNTQDFRDRFLLLVKGNFEVYKKLYPDYFTKCNGF